MEEGGSKLVGKIQSAFMGGRNIQDEVLIANEIVEDWKRRASSSNSILRKLIMIISTGSILFRMFKRFGFLPLWIRWMEACVTTQKLSVLVNDSLTNLFSTQKGLRQGDPLSHFRFILAAEGVTIMSNKAADLGTVKGFSLENEDVRMTHLQLADDTFVFCETDMGMITHIKRILR
ncbi:uncharacterized protein LOC130763941 [Actinidia eriantha]|uniref:uncharacterized protein LOC130763941 n=1 Tax=Actinidia eriantha TaxID=165200 RepID=UPI00258ED818|nr:uncharacterized protein LOC130763941 [Actinidia eriantha]